MVRLARVAALLVALVLVAPGSAGAAGFVVNSTADTGDAAANNGVCADTLGRCTLRAAVEEANALFGSDTISVPPGTYPTGSALQLASQITLAGTSGARATAIDGVTSADVLVITQAGTSVRGLTITGGRVGIRASAPDTILDQLVVRGNANTFAGQAEGAGIVVAPGGNVLLTRSAVTGNTVASTGTAALGGGIDVFPTATITAVATTIADNTAAGFSTSFGGGVNVYAGGAAVFRHVTMVGNRATAVSSGGNLYRGGQVTVTDSIIAGGQAQSGANCSSAPTSTGRNIDSGTTCGFGAGHLSATDPQLQLLGDYGGPTDTAPPMLASPARDQADSCPDGGLDQRGAPAPTGGACDIGAAELSTDLATSAQASVPQVAAGGDVTYVLRVANAGFDAAAATALDVQLGGAVGVLVATPSVGTCTVAVRCELGTLARGQEATVTVVARAGASGALSMTATASGDTPDSAATNNSAALSIPILVAAAPPPPRDTTRPALGRLRLVGVARTRRAIRLRTTLSETARVTMRIERLIPGRRVGRKCRRVARRGPRCTIVRRVGTVTRRTARGRRIVTIPRRVAKKFLPRGRYRVVAFARDAAGNRSVTRRAIVIVRK